MRTHRLPERTPMDGFAKQSFVTTSHERTKQLEGHDDSPLVDQGAVGHRGVHKKAPAVAEATIELRVTRERQTRYRTCFRESSERRIVPVRNGATDDGEIVPDINVQA
jgi:hypothetical protein